MQLLGFSFLCFTLCDGANILGVFNHPGASHTFLGKVLLKNLALKGHQVTMISSFPMIEDVPNYKDISLPELLEDLKSSFETPRPYTPNIIPVGGFHIQELKKLPQDLKAFLDSATEGAILFSLGSQIRSSTFNKTIIAHIIKAFEKVPQKILWKYESNDLPNLPNNIKILKWLPQAEVLAHPNVKLFISHGGSLSFIEAMHFSVPLLCIPFNGDQLTNAAFIESRSIGHYILPGDIKEGIFFNMLQELITNIKYQDEMDFRSNLLREQPIKPLDLAIFWVEHVIKHKETDHLKTFAIKLPWYKYYLLDVIILFLVIFVICLKLIWFIIRSIYRTTDHFFTNSKKSKMS